MQMLDTRGGTGPSSQSGSSDDGRKEPMGSNVNIDNNFDDMDDDLPF